MQRTARKSTVTTMITLLALLGLASLGLRYQASVKGSGGKVQPQGLFGSGDHFIFTNGSLKGTYAGVLTGTAVGGPLAGPNAVSYVYTADGNGNVTNADATVNINGQSFPNINFPGTYTVSTNGTVSMTVIPTNGPLTGIPLSISHVVTETSNGQITELRGVGTTPGIVATNVDKRIRR